MEGGGADRNAVTGRRRFDQAALALGAEPIAIAADHQHMTVVQVLIRLLEQTLEVFEAIADRIDTAFGLTNRADA